MTWSAPADPDAFAEALAWFRKRVPLTKAEYRRLTDEQKRKAFYVSGTAQADVVHQVWKAVDEAVAKGTTLEDFKKAVGPKLLAAWQGTVKDPAWRLETIFRQNVQNAYSAGRYHQAIDPAVLSDRPVWMFDAVLDSRTTNICRQCDGTKLEADAPWWRTHHPPLHFSCRSGFITLTAAEAGRLTTVFPKLLPAEGFGALPHEEGDPEPKEYPKPIADEHEAKMAKAPPKASPRTFTPDVHALSFRSNLSDEETAHMLGAVNDAGLLKYLEKKPLEKLVFEEQSRVRKKDVNGWYAGGILKELHVTTKREPRSDKIPGGWSISNAAKSAEDARRRTFVHELGHHVHMGSGDAKVDRVIRDAYAKARKAGVALTRYALVDRYEYFAESFAAYFRERKALRKHDPAGLAMVEEVLELTGIR